MDKIITVTANTAIDLYVEIEGLSVKDNIVAQNSYEFACGKGVNVARGVASLGSPVTCLGFVGSQSLPPFRALDSDLLRSDFNMVEGKTRTNITLFDTRSDRETHIRTAGFSINYADRHSLDAKLSAMLSPGDIVVLAGSLPSGAGDNWYADLIEVCHSRQAFVILDSNNNALRAGIEAKPQMIKPNRQELEQLVGLTLGDWKSIVSAARDLVEKGINRVFVSLGAQGAIAVDRQTALAGNVAKAPPGIVTHIGCGDALVAGLAVATLYDYSPETSLKNAIACGVANLYWRQPGQFDSQLQQQLLSQIDIRHLQIQ